jgi:hypothetical protein
VPSFRSDLALLGLAVVGVVSDLACVLTGHTPPALFEQVALAGLTGAAGVALPFRAASDSDSAAAGTQAPTTYQAAPPAAQVPQSPAAVVQPYTGPVGQ